MNLQLKSLACAAVLALSVFTAGAQQTSFPLVGAQVYVEPGQTAGQIDTLFLTLQQSHMHVARIRLFGAHVMKDSGFDFTLYDAAFDAARRHGVRLFVTLFPPTDELTDIGGFKFPDSPAQLDEVDRYVAAVAARYGAHLATYCWVLQNEPGLGAGSVPETSLSKIVRAEWEAKAGTWQRPEGYLSANLDEERFLRYYTVWYLSHLAAVVSEHEAVPHPVHANMHALLDNLPEYDFPALQQTLSSLGVSMHLSWHFRYFSRPQYPMAISLMADITRSAAGRNPFWVTELQGGNVTMSGFTPLCPTREEITQWLWTNVAAGAEGIIFWTLNPRRAVREAGEWGMIDYQGRPSDRLEAAASVAQTLEADSALFAALRPASSPVTIVYDPVAFIIQQRNTWCGDTENEARMSSAVIKSVAGAYAALSSMGITPQVVDAEQMHWQPSECGVLLLPHIVALSEAYSDSLEAYCQRGGTVVMTGLTGYYDELMRCRFMEANPAGIFSHARLREVKTVEQLTPVVISGQKLNTHLWRGFLMGREGEDNAATACQVGSGRLVWIPQMIDLADYISPSKRLPGFYTWLLKDSLASCPTLLSRPNRFVQVRRMTAADGRQLIVLTNTSDRRERIRFRHRLWTSRHQVSVLAGQPRFRFRRMSLPPHSTVVILVGI